MRKKNTKLFNVTWDNKIEPSQYVWDIIIKVNRNILKGVEHYEGLTNAEIKDLIRYHTDNDVLYEKSKGYQEAWLELRKKYIGDINK